MRGIVLAGLAAILGSSPVHAECPTGALLDGPGIRLERDQPFFSSMFFRRHGRIEERRRQLRDGEEVAVEATYRDGLLPTSRTSRHNGRPSIVTVNYDADGFDLKDLPRIGTARLRAKLSVDSKLEDAHGSYELRYLGPSRVTIGGCAYAVWKVRVASKLGRDHTVFQHDFAPDLGLVIKTTRLDPTTGKPVSRVRFDRIERGGIRKR